jgi:hypothetical protein
MQHVKYNAVVNNNATGYVFTGLGHHDTVLREKALPGK